LGKVDSGNDARIEIQLELLPYEETEKVPDAAVNSPSIMKNEIIQ
jgi:hypothetical protein